MQKSEMVLKSTSQHGFVRSKTTAINLRKTLQSISSLSDEGRQVDVVYMDKALDCINHNIMLDKLSNAGLCHDLIKLFRSLL